jgi:hypothetical protein
MIAEAAYFRAQRRGFQGGNPVDDWLVAEAEVAHALAWLQDPDPLSITQEELGRLMARAREAQLELRAEALEIKEQNRWEDRPSDAQLGDNTWESLSAELRSIASDGK